MIQLERRDEAATRWERIAVIVIGRNTGHFLGECLASIMGQSLPADEIVYVDDASGDNSVEVAGSFAGVVLAALPVQVGMCRARMWGLTLTKSEFILFVDSDNKLPADYLAIMAAELRSGFDLVYPSKHFFGEGPRFIERARKTPGLLWTPPEYSAEQLWRANFIDTCSMMRRDALLWSGGWQENEPDTQQDWSLALRISSNFRVKLSAAVLEYRVHDSNWSERERDLSREQIRASVRKSAASLTIGTVYSGRLGTVFFYEWIANIHHMLSAAGMKAELVIMDDSPEGCPPVSHRETFASVAVHRIHRGVSPVARRKDRYHTGELLTGAFNAILDRCKTDLLWMVEDDIFPEKDACKVMVAALCQEPLHAAVGGFYRSRHGPARYVASTVGEQVNYFTEIPTHRPPVDFTGTGCLMVARRLLGAVRFGIEWHHKKYYSQGHDWVFAWRLKEAGRPVIMLPEVQCRHYQTPGTFV